MILLAFGLEVLGVWAMLGWMFLRAEKAMRYDQDTRAIHAYYTHKTPHNWTF